MVVECGSNTGQIVPIPIKGWSKAGTNTNQRLVESTSIAAILQREAMGRLVTPASPPLAHMDSAALVRGLWVSSRMASSGHGEVVTPASPLLAHVRKMEQRGVIYWANTGKMLVKWMRRGRVLGRWSNTGGQIPA
jgi:hypothetical protein